MVYAGTHFRFDLATEAAAALGVGGLRTWAGYVLGMIALALIGCGGSTTETPADLGIHDAGTPDATDSSGDTGMSDSGNADAGSSDDVAPRPLGFDECRTKADCTDPWVVSCEPPPVGVLRGAGPCSGGPPCTSDSECQADGGDEVCVVPSQPCPGTTTMCGFECLEPATCEPGQACTGHRCVALPCQSDTQCPADSACVAGGCVQKTCTTDATCGGYCVLGKCYPAPGWCLNNLPL